VWSRIVGRGPLRHSDLALVSKGSTPPALSHDREARGGGPRDSPGRLRDGRVVHVAATKSGRTWSSAFATSGLTPQRRHRGAERMRAADIALSCAGVLVERRVIVLSEHAGFGEATSRRLGFPLSPLLHGQAISMIGTWMQTTRRWVGRPHQVGPPTSADRRLAELPVLLLGPLRRGVIADRSQSVALCVLQSSWVLQALVARRAHMTQRDVRRCVRPRGWYSG